MRTSKPQPSQLKDAYIQNGHVHQLRNKIFNHCKNLWVTFLPLEATKRASEQTVKFLYCSVLLLFVMPIVWRTISNCVVTSSLPCIQTRFEPHDQLFDKLIPRVVVFTYKLSAL